MPTGIYVSLIHPTLPRVEFRIFSRANTFAKHCDFLAPPPATMIRKAFVMSVNEGKSRLPCVPAAAHIVDRAINSPTTSRLFYKHLHRRRARVRTAALPDLGGARARSEGAWRVKLLHFLASRFVALAAAARVCSRRACSNSASALTIVILSGTRQLFGYAEIEDEGRWAAIAQTEVIFAQRCTAKCYNI